MIDINLEKSEDVNKVLCVKTYKVGIARELTPYPPRPEPIF
jgi:hypothetical protein